MYRIYRKYDKYETLVAEAQSYETGLNRLYRFYRDDKTATHTLYTSSGGKLCTYSDLDKVYAVVATLMMVAPFLPEGLVDHKSIQKYNAEFSELVEAVATKDSHSMLLEAADCLYYLSKAVATKIATYEDLINSFLYVVGYTGCMVPDVLAACMAKYGTRMIYGKDQDLEHKVCTQVVATVKRVR